MHVAVDTIRVDNLDTLNIIICMDSVIAVDMAVLSKNRTNLCCYSKSIICTQKRRMSICCA